MPEKREPSIRIIIKRDQLSKEEQAMLDRYDAGQLTPEEKEKFGRVEKATFDLIDSLRPPEEEYRTLITKLRNGIRLTGDEWRKLIPTPTPKQLEEAFKGIQKD